ncbi:DNA-directed RNA polymerase III subunit RPC8 [Trichogramma pretiosum]|uniref:DNA-directed RNA polymerase III subunit RPC8 n=1 Tax=Trichogramma pretiosum TaxID=7493 RepID=UPI0006C94E86|nr:DNA-directed RNA polymerase III subunit RPC8 [Trichogramma pretiosum]
MFVLTEFKDTVQILPHKFKKKLNDAITNELNRKLANKVFYKVGLCIALHDITHISESFIVPGDGSSHTKVNFRFVVFRPFIDEVIVGRIRSCDSEGVHVTLGFFEDIIIKPENLKQNSIFNQAEQAWVWQYEGEDGNVSELFMDIGEPIRFRVCKEFFAEALIVNPSAKKDSDEKKETTPYAPPYMLEGDIDATGLGLLSWWANV